jgi:predicted transcriptional regulator
MRETLGDLEARDRKGAMLHFLDDASPQEIDELKAALAEIERRSMTNSGSTSGPGTRRFRRA